MRVLEVSLESNWSMNVNNLNISGQNTAAWKSSYPVSISSSDAFAGAACVVVFLYLCTNLERTC